MRVHRLRATAFGPFAGEVAVDVDALGAAGLFLVHGPTGAGKTSLLDAVCFALYGDVPGPRSAKGLRSDHAPPGAVPSVELEFSCGPRRFLVRRSPSHRRPKQRGGGERTFPATVELREWRGGELATVSTRIDEAAEVLDDVLGMGKEQFAKVVLLPQGDFAAFLRASPEGRRLLLERLFDIERYADLERWLVEARRGAGVEVEEAGAALDVDLARLEEVVAGAGTPAGPRLRRGSPDLAARVADVTAAVEQRVADTMARFDAACTAERRASDALAAARLRDSHVSRAAAARRTLAGLAGRADELARARAVLEGARRAAAVSGHLDARDRARADVDRSVVRLSEAAGRAADAGLPPGPDPEAVAAVAAVVARHDADVGGLVRLATAREEHAAAVADLRGRVADLEAEAPVRERGVTVAEEALGRARTVVDGLATAAAALDLLEVERDAARDRLTAGRAVLLDRERLLVLRERAAGARELAAAARVAELDLRQRRLDGMAGELAARLAAGAPCPVCGGTEHPHPAAAEQPVTAADIQAAAAEADRLAKEAAATGHGVAALARSVADREAALGGVVDLGALETATARAEEAVEAAAERVAGADEARRLLTVRAASLERARAAVGALTAQTAVTRGRLEESLRQDARDAAALVGLVAAHAQACPCAGSVGATEAAHPDAEAVAALARAHLHAGRAARELVAATSEHAEAVDRLATAEVSLTRGLHTAGLPDADTARAAARPPAEVARLAEEVSTADAQRAAAEAILTAPDVVEALAAPDVDPATLEETASAARSAMLRAKDESGAAERAARALGPLAAQVAARAESLGPALERHARLKALADTVTGTGADNTLRMRLTSFVLAARLEKVVALANERLALMGAGRYLLEHSDERAAAGARGGLGLKVLDQWTGRARETSSLSGGESFMASLSLALGLADAVREEAGGVEIGTLFVDEGFGSLDEDSLEQVLTVLDALREGGRAVGVVSHVPELRARIPSQVVVRKTTTGSTVSTTAGPHAATGAGAA